MQYTFIIFIACGEHRAVQKRAYHRESVSISHIMPNTCAYALASQRPRCCPAGSTPPGMGDEWSAVQYVRVVLLLEYVLSRVDSMRDYCLWLWRHLRRRTQTLWHKECVWACLLTRSQTHTNTHTQFVPAHQAKLRITPIYMRMNACAGWLSIRTHGDHKYSNKQKNYDKY